jgi:hypothetical protein
VRALSALALAGILAIGCGKKSGDPVPAAHVVKTTAPLAEADLDRLAAITIPGFKSKLHERRDPLLEMRHMSEGKPRLGVVVRATACTGGCWPMDLASWKPHEDDLKKILPEQLQDRPEVTFELGAATVAGTPMIYTYALGVYYTGASSGGAIGAFVDAYTLYYNDGVNMIRVVVAYADDGVATPDELTAAAPRDKLAALAALIIATYLAAW